MNAGNENRLFRKIIELESEDPSELADILALSVSGYNDYQQFRPGMRFIESLALWLKQFSENQRSIAYNFIKKRVLYISSQEMEHTVSIVYQDFVLPILLCQVATSTDIPNWKINTLKKSTCFKTLHAKTLFLGLSDGSHIDKFRRSNESINHEQILRTHEISEERAKKLKKKLQERLKSNDNYFENIFLLDDFSASGISYIKEGDEICGKIATFLNSIEIQKNPLYKLVDKTNLRIYLILYYATETAVLNIKNRIEKVFSSIKFDVISANVILDKIKLDESEDFMKLVKEYGYENIIDKHFKQGNVSKQYLGFDGGALPLIIYHNTPNNSLPILHRNDSRTKFKGLFPRISRHNDDF